MKQLHIVIVGGGFAGVKAALELANKPGISVTLLSNGENFEYHGALYRTATGRSPLEVVIPLRDIFSRAKNVEVVIDSLTGIDSTKQLAFTELGATYAYDRILLAMGNTVNYFGLEGMAEHSIPMDTIASTIRLRMTLSTLYKQGQPVTVAVVGAGASGVELAGELQHFAHMVASRYDRKAVKVDVKLVEGANRVLPLLSEKASTKAAKRLRSLGVQVLLNTKVSKCKPNELVLEGGTIKADVIVWTAGTRAVDFYAAYPELFELERGRVKVNEYLQTTKHQAIYVLGDNAFTPFTGMAQTALHDAKFVARNILREQRGKPPVAYRAAHPIYVIPVGPRWAVLQTAKGVRSGNAGWLVRRRADLAIYENFEPYKKALKIWRKGNKLARF